MKFFPRLFLFFLLLYHRNSIPFHYLPSDPQSIGRIMHNIKIHFLIREHHRRPDLRHAFAVKYVRLTNNQPSRLAGSPSVVASGLSIVIEKWHLAMAKNRLQMMTRGEEVKKKKRWYKVNCDELFCHNHPGDSKM